MCYLQNPQNLTDGDSEGSYNSDSSRDDSPPYTPDELADIFLDFYRFLSTLHFDPAHLKVAPSGGWPNITREARPEWKSDEAIEVLRRLPYFDAKTNKSMIHYKSILIDYSSMEPQDFSAEDWMEELMEFWNDEDITDPAYVIAIASGHESFGRSIWLDVKHGMITEDLCRIDQLSPKDVKDWFADLKERYLTLKLIPSKWRATIEADDVPERASSLGLITLEELCAQTESWGTNLDVQYLRQMYRELGWPDAFRREEAVRAVKEVMNLIEDRRMDWEVFLYDEEYYRL
ncbi:hypothetical protein CDD80_4334 [Ophiocordyceps camponoti-rufipedis]|uniref:Uncharacterized protein n=1 Tax=Ophiocordyceps camponoti-rufipedis TaxID=2004952 RepID=A0A2C5ZMK0_9HYPO|nr:hypothetical protein CDD80_4334 [Ophiocordyceps camponoti-rufipedis]